MRHFSDDTRELLVIAGEIARSRNSMSCSSKDLAIAVVVYRKLREHLDFEPVKRPTLSPEMLGFEASVERLIVGDGELEVAELVALAASENPDLAEYLG
ncbi:hypothetical protein HRW07_25330 [Streptomyces lunaelactis]|uniref:hypothetical protein n=1 Tax=Streptomyces lunaelactis TaxID=1535768 RepID=UPI001585BC0A|nr:hypothetical protein [Streptomyces lunaelactis]NUL06496.1 hypothetical protein [Streptomyces lunaelactis]